MQYLTVMYDPKCGLCSRIGTWLRAQPKWIPLGLLPSDRAAGIYPALAERLAQDELVVVSDDGGMYLGDHAWLMCFYALRHYRHWAKRLSSPSMLPLARQAFTVLSANPLRVSRWLGLMSDAELFAELWPVNAPRCHGADR